MADISAIISALLQRTEEKGATEAEAEAAMKRARKLMREHGLTAEDVLNRTEACVDFHEETVRSGFVEMNYVEQILVTAIARFTETMPVRGVNADGTFDMSFFGYRVDTELAHYIYNVCVTALGSEWDKYKVRLATKDRSEARAGFQIGMALRLKERLDDLTVDESTGTDLIVLKNQLVVAAFAAATGPTVKIDMIVEYDPSIAAFHDGFEAAEKIRFNREVAKPHGGAKQIGG